MPCGDPRFLGMSAAAAFLSSSRGAFQYSPPRIGGDDERQRVGVVDQVHIE